MAKFHIDETEKPLPRVRLRFTQEGWIFLVILLFISTGAVLRNINLLILITGAMIGPLLLSWRLSIVTLDRLIAIRRVPGRLFAGRKVPIIWDLDNRRRLISSWQLNIDDQISPANDNRKSSIGKTRLTITELRAGRSVCVGYHVYFARRGEYVFGPAKCSTRFPFGLIEARFVDSENESVKVAPATGRLSATWDRRLMSHASGNKAIKRKKGHQDEEFFGVREWRTGDSRRHIHWRSTAKHGKLMVKQFDSRSDRDLVLVLDLAHDDLDDSSESTARDAEIVLSFASTLLTSVAVAIKGKIAFAVCGREVMAISEQFSRNFVDSALEMLAVAKTDPNPAVERGILEVAREISGGTPFYVISTRSRPDFRQWLDEVSRSHIDRVDPWIRWVQVRSLEFRQSFTPPDVLADSTPSTESAGAKHVVN